MALSSRHPIAWALGTTLPMTLLAQQPPSEDKKPAQEDVLANELLSLLNTKIETASKGQKQSLAEAPAIVSVVTGEEARALGYQSVAQALEAVPGLYLLNDRVAPNLGVRGINGGLRAYSRIVKVMIDGQPVSFRPDATNFLGPELIPMEAVERIEVVRGPASSLYGANAFLGVINIITRKAEWNRFGGSAVAKATAGSNHKGSGLEAMISSRGSEWDVLLALSSSNLDLSGDKLPVSSPLLRVRPDLMASASAKEESRPMSALLRASWKPADLLKLELQSHYSRLDAYGEFLDFGVLTHENRIQVDNQYTRVKAEWQALPSMAVSASFALASGEPGPGERLSSGEVLTRPRRDLSYDAQDAALEARWNLRERDSLTVGADRSSEEQQLMTVYTVNKATGAATAPSGVQPKKTFTNTGLYAQYMVFPFKALGLTFNARTDNHNVYGIKNTSRVGLVAPIGQGFHAKLLYGTSFKAPAAWQLYAQPLFGGEVLGNPALKPETAETVEAEVGWKPSDTMAFTLSAYHNRVKDKVELLPRASNQVPLNAGIQSGSGLEGQALVGFQKHVFTASFAWQKTDAEAPRPFLGDIVEPTTLYPSLTAHVRWRFLYASGQSAGMEARYASERRASASNISENLLRPYQLDAYTRLDAFWSGTWALKHGSFKGVVRVDNLLDTRIVESGFQGVDVQQPGRRIVLSASYLF